MGAWPGKYVIGLTGNIATGKSMVRKILEHLGAYGIDADGLAHRVMAKGAPAYPPIVEEFGQWVLDEEGEIDRKKLGQIVFKVPQAMEQLERIVHPFVGQATDILAKRASQPVIVIEAIKLLEGDLKGKCDAIWVTVANPEMQLRRLRRKRGLTESEAQLRINAQNTQAEKVSVADVVLDNNGTVEDLWRQVLAAYKRIGAPELVQSKPKPLKAGEISVERAGPKQAKMIAQFVERVSGGTVKWSRMDVMTAFGEKAFMLLMVDSAILGVVGWQVENLVTRLVDFYIDPRVPLEKAVGPLMTKVESASKELLCEAALLFLPAHIAKAQVVWEPLGYAPRTIESISVRAWQEAARETRRGMDRNKVLLFKQLRKDRILRPI